jgi:hypothetical protein
VWAWRAAYRSTLAGAPGPGCPGQDALASLAVGDLPPGDRVRVADHVVACAACASDYRILAELHREASARARTRGSWRAAAVAAVVVAALAGVLAPGDKTPALDPDRPRGRPGTRAVTPAPDAALAAAPAELSWPAEPLALGYRVRLFDARAEPIWESPAAQTTSRPLPQDVRERLRAGGGYFWIVDVGAEAAPHRLGPFWFHLPSDRP